MYEDENVCVGCVFLKTLNLHQNVETLYLCDKENQELFNSSEPAPAECEDKRERKK